MANQTGEALNGWRNPNDTPRKSNLLPGGQCRILLDTGVQPLCVEPGRKTCRTCAVELARRHVTPTNIAGLLSQTSIEQTVSR